MNYDGSLNCMILTSMQPELSLSMLPCSLFTVRCLSESMYRPSSVPTQHAVSDGHRINKQEG